MGCWESPGLSGLSFWLPTDGFWGGVEPAAFTKTTCLPSPKYVGFFDDHGKAAGRLPGGSQVGDGRPLRRSA